jgi:hypothetical protein
MTDSSLTWQAIIDQQLAEQQFLQEEQRSHSHHTKNPHVPDVNLPLSVVKLYETISITEVSLGTSSEEISQPVDLFQVLDPVELGPAVGVVLRYEQTWRMKGLSIGRLLHSLCLAPGEVTQIAMLDWQRETQGNAFEDVGEQEEASQSALRRRITDEITNAVANELQKGRSSVSSFASQADAGAGGVLGLLGGSASTSKNFSMATSVNWSAGSRNVSAESLQKIRELTAQHAANARSRRATLVQEVTESETEQFTTRVIANYNHMHSLNMQYYEVLQVYELGTRPVQAERCIFLPMRIQDIELSTLRLFKAQLATAARAMGKQNLAEAIQNFELTQRQVQREIERLTSLEVDIGKQIETAKVNLELAKEKIIPLRREQEELIQERHAMGQIDPSKLPEIDKKMLDIQARLREADDARKAAAEQVTQRAEDRKTIQRQLSATIEGQTLAAEEIIKRINQHKLAFNQALWMQLNPTSVGTMLDGHEHLGTALVETVDPKPIAVFGNYLGFRWNFPDTPEGDQDSEKFTRRYVDTVKVPALDTHVLPTDGVFAEAVLGQANAAEKLDLTRFWHWDENTIPILPTAIKKLIAPTRATRGEAVPGQLDAPSVRLASLPTAPATSARGLVGVVGASLFRDMSGSEVIGDLLEAGQQAAAAGSKDAQEIAHQNISAYLDHIEQLLPALTNAISEGSLDPSTLGALSNALGGEGEFDATALINIASKAGLLL